MSEAGPDDYAAAWWQAAVDLARQLADGRGLPVRATSLRLGQGETPHAEITAGCWWYGGRDVHYQHSFFAFGPPVLFAATAAASLVANEQRRSAAMAQARTQWRYVGHCTILLTDQRLLIPIEGRWNSLWHANLMQIVPDLGRRWLGLSMDGHPPYALEGPAVPYLAVALQFVLEASVLPLPIAPPPLPSAPARQARWSGGWPGGRS